MTAAAASASSRVTTMAMPPPRGVATTWLRRSPGWSNSLRRSAYRRAHHVSTAATASTAGSPIHHAAGMAQSTA